jgi:hypothetical protein
MPRAKRSRLLIGAAFGAVVLAGAGAVAVHRTGLFADRGPQQWNALKHYCLDCHDSAEATGGVVFEGLRASAIPDHPKLFETAVRKLRGRLMPPPGGPQPKQALVDGFVKWAENSLDHNPRLPKAGHTGIQRLDRAEYAAAVKDLLGVKIDPAKYLPAEVEVDGFDNIAAALGVSPAFLEQYIGAARKVARLAVGEDKPKLASAHFLPPSGDQDDYVDGMPLGTRGGTRFDYDFPADGEYHIALTDLDVGLYPRSLETVQTVVVLIDRKEVFRAKLGGPADLELVNRGGAPARAEIMKRFADIPAKVTAGVHEVAVTFIERSRAATDGEIYGFTPYGGFSFTGKLRVPRIIGEIDVVGPYRPTGISATASRKKIFVCVPESPAQERPCAERIATRLARRAFRRPVHRQDVDRLMPFYEAGRRNGGGFDGGIEQVVAAVLASPDFLYRAIVPPPGIGNARYFALTDLELASRLSFFLWSSVPDERLLELAAAGKLHDPDVLQAQVRRMLADPRAERLVGNFALRWLNLDDLDSVQPDKRLFPKFDDGLRRDFETEIRLFLKSVLIGNRSVLDLLNGKQTFLDERLARQYGITSVHGPQFRPVTLTDPARFGLLGKAAVLLRTSYGDRTSPVLRGAWVLDKLMGTPPTPPPPNVNTDLTTPKGQRPKTMRAKLELHRSNPTCNGCHGVIDPYGLALENFDVTGKWRDRDAAADEVINARTVLPTGMAVNGPAALRDALLRRPDQFVQAFTEKLMMYALGRKLAYYDMPQVRAIVRSAARKNYKFSAIVAGIVASSSFRYQALPSTAAAGAQITAAR